jgi:4-carboxymuconolactone decarboxylase
MTADQQAVYDLTAAGPRESVPAPVVAWLRSPELARRGQHLGAFVRYQTTLPSRLSELAILIVARHWTAQYEWAAHVGEAERAGLAPAVIEAIAGRRPPPLASDDERVVVALATALLETRTVPDATYRAAVSALGERGVVELVGVLGYYTWIAMTLNAFEIEPEAAAPRLAP